MFRVIAHRNINLVLERAVPGKVVVNTADVQDGIAQDIFQAPTFDALADGRFIPEELAGHTLRNQDLFLDIQSIRRALDHIEVEDAGNRRSNREALFFEGLHTGGFVAHSQEERHFVTPHQSPGLDMRRGSQHPLRVRAAGKRGSSDHLIIGFDAEDAVAVGRRIVESNIVVPLHHNHHKRCEGYRHPQHIQRHRQPETTEYRPKVANNWIHRPYFLLLFLSKYIQLSCQNR